MSEPATLANMRKHGCRPLLVHYSNNRTCWHHPVIDGDFLPDDTIVKSLEPRMVCTRCGLIGADVRPIGGRIRSTGDR